MKKTNSITKEELHEYLSIARHCIIGTQTLIKELRNQVIAKQSGDLLACPKCGTKHPCMDELVDELCDVVHQATRMEDGTLDSMALSANASGMRLLARLGKLTIDKEYGRRIIAHWPNQASARGKSASPRKETSRLDSVVLRLYRAAKALSDSCGDNYGIEAADNGEYERYYNDKAKDALDKVLAEFETQNEKVEAPK
jgi:hypothetical protein